MVAQLSNTTYVTLRVHHDDLERTIAALAAAGFPFARQVKTWGDSDPWPAGEAALVQFTVVTDNQQPACQEYVLTQYHSALAKASIDFRLQSHDVRAGTPPASPPLETDA